MKSKFFKFFLFIALFFSTLVIYRIFFADHFSKEDLEAIDQNANGIWDDLEPYIDRTATNFYQRKALQQLFLTLQNALLNPESGLDIKNGEDKDNKHAKALACLRKAWVGVMSAPDVDDWRDHLLSNPARMRAYIKYNAKLSGGTYGLWKEEAYGDPCEFEVSK